MKYLLLLVAFSMLIESFGQNDWCGFDHQKEKYFENNPNAENEMYERYERISSGQIVAEERVDDIIIPVVVHVIHDNGIGNISYAQIEDAIRVLNEDYNHNNPDVSSIRNTSNAPFLNESADVGISFALAKRDPNGNCTNGVERRNSSIGTYNGNDELSKFYDGGGLDAWDRNRYFNIWVVNSIEYTGSLENGVILGYAQFPSWGSADTYGVIIRHDRFGEIGTGSTDRTITHEVGHCLGLAHTFQSGCGNNGSNCSAQGDGCCDTPPVDEAHWSCIVNQNNCSQVPAGDFYGFDAYDQFENFMSYSPCQYMFSEDQKSIALSNISDLTHLNNLASAQNQIDAGVGLPAILCESEFSSSETVICVGSTVDFSDFSYSGVTSRSWSFTGGTPDVSVDSAVTITYNTAGVYPVSLNVSDGTSAQTETKLNYVTVLPSPGVDLPYFEGFEDITFPDNYNFFVQNDDSNNDWQVTDNASSTGDKSVKLTNYNMAGGSKDAFISGPIDLSNVDPNEENVLMTFKYAYNKRSEDNDEYLRVYVSIDCGETWVPRKSIHGDNLSESQTPFSYSPDSDEWVQVTLTNIIDTYFVPNFRYKFEFTGDGGNNIFIDDINLYPESWLGNDEIEVTNTVSIYPNPSTDVATLQFFSTSSEVTTIEIYNLVGERVQFVHQGMVLKGLNEFELQTLELPTGIYFVNVKTESGLVTSKLVKK